MTRKQFSQTNHLDLELFLKNKKKMICLLNKQNFNELFLLIN